MSGVYSHWCVLLLLLAIGTHRALALIGIPRAGMNRNLVLNGGTVKLLLSPQRPDVMTPGTEILVQGLRKFTKVEVDRQQ